MKGTTAFHRMPLLAVLAAGAFLCSLGVHAASTAAKKSAAKPAPAKKPVAKSLTARKPSAKSGTARTTRKSSYNPRRTRPQPFRYRLARLKLQPERITEIQRALGQAGYLNQEPNGKWDDATRNAMLRFQQDHGFPATGLPEAKSLLKLGLGPHPLPEELDSRAQASPAAAPPDGPARTDPTSADPASQVPQQ